MPVHVQRTIAELHLKYGEVAVACREAMRSLGLAASAPIGISAG